jgi:hypothetical protein
MSLATLKRKTQTKYNNMSVGSKTGFSLNGGHRNQGYVGQTMLSRRILKGDVTSENDPKVVKPSVMNTNGMIRTHYRWIWRPQPYSTTKEDTHRIINSQSNYIKNISANTVSAINNSYPKIELLPIGCNNLPRDALPKRKDSSQIIQTRFSGNITKMNFSRPEKNNPIAGIGGGNYLNTVYSQDEYITRLNSTNADITENVIRTSNCVTKPMNENILRTPLIGGTRAN